MVQKPKPRTNRTLKFLIISFLIITLIFLAQYINIPVILNNSILWVQTLGIFGPIAYILIYNLATILFIPGSILTLKGGCLFGLYWGSVCVLIAAIIGAILAFIVGRYLSRDWVSRQINKYPQFKAIDLAVAKEGWKIVLLTRLCPIFPFNLLNYAFGVTQVTLKDYILGSFGIIPGTVMYVYMGSLAGDLATLNAANQPTNPEAQIWQWVMQIIGLIATITITIYITKIAQKALRESMTTAEITNDETNN
ncbi:SNARE associated Golgi family protein [Nodularia spumigena CENA596]|uniref:TVP38/TMEM64 family membrane protein n=1 Tax=Nodularia spumigena CENA596 TaxID=1819295 RepID=A0A166JXN7_NODSP|nr:TVP38/TMEM64 family protein [Nodularia spumigena]KZL50278.1 SNARE associated Golgi family protein [Nodularia spumigena CENA596]